MGGNWISTLKRWWPLFLISSLSLFFELAVIRWLSGEIRIFAYFQNLSLLAAFLGLAIGFGLVGKGRENRFMFPALWGIFVILVLAISFVNESKPLFNPGSNDIALWYTLPAPYWSSLIVFIFFLIIFFLLSMFLFIPLGQATGMEMAVHPPIQAYVVNIAASLAGIWIFTLLSYFHTPPLVWFGLGLAGISAFFFSLKKLSKFTLAIFAFSLVGIAIFGRGTVWSPYNRLNLTELVYTKPGSGTSIKTGYFLNIQQTFYQSALNLSDDYLQKLRDMKLDDLANLYQEAASVYNFPYQLVPPQSQVLIVGAGMGNDVAAALRNGAGHIDAVEIDPVILSYGRQYHPEKPYDDPRVNAVIDDARSFFNKSQKSYDLVVFGLLDSHTLLSGMTSVRLDSFVYTLDSFEQVKKHLQPGGTVVISFAANEWIAERIGRMMLQVFGTEEFPIYRLDQVGFTVFTVGNIQNRANIIPWKPNSSYDNLPIPTDDWPYLYQRLRQIPSGYWQAILVLAIICLFIIIRSFPEALHPDLHFWLLGAAFLLIEFKSITELALLFGTTWFVNTLAISGILVMALCANLLVLRTKRVNLGVAYGLLFASLALSFFFPLEWLAGFPSAWKAILSTAILSIPLFFAGIIFSESLRRAGETARPMASNFSGSAVGGLLEYGSSLWGIKSLYVIAGVLYLGAMLAAFFKRGSRA